MTTAGKSSVTYPLDLTVLPLPAWAAGTFDGGAATDPAGLATLTVASSGKVSGKWLSGGLAWALAAPYFDAAVDPAAAEAEQAFRASVVGTSDKLAFTNAVTVVGDALGGIATNALFAAYQNNWKAEPWKTVAKPFAKAPALVLPAAGEQPGEIALKFAASGAATAAGKFLLGTDAKGKEIVHSASCAAVVVPETEPDAQGAFKAVVHLYFAPNEKKGFAGAVRLVRLRWTGTAFEVE